MSEELKPCPWCARQPACTVSGFARHTDTVTAWDCGCVDCLIFFRRKTKEEAIAAWNRRPAAGAFTDAQVEAAARAFYDTIWDGVDCWTEAGDIERADYQRGMRAGLRAASLALLDTPPGTSIDLGAGVLDGWKLVPIEPDIFMITAGSGRHRVGTIWRAMLNASPVPPPAMPTSEIADAGRNLAEALAGMIAEYERQTRYGSPMAKAANPRVSNAHEALAQWNATAGKGGS